MAALNHQWCAEAMHIRVSLIPFGDASGQRMRYHKLLVPLGLIALVIVSVASPAIAHETQTVEGYDVTFGGADEPLITGERMWLELEIVDNETDEPVENQSETLTVAVQKLGSEKATIEVDEKHGEPGVYEVPVIFTKPGEYLIHVEGSIEGTEFHTHFETEVEAHTELLYPSEESESNATQTTESS